MTESVSITLEGKTIALPVVTGSEEEKALDISKLRDATGYITLDQGYGNTGSCTSAITYIDGDAGILRYRGIPIEQFEQAPILLKCAGCSSLAIYPRQKNTATSVRV